MCNLAHGGSAVGMYPPGEFSKIRHDLIITGIKVAIGRGGVWSNQRATPEHGQAYAAFGFFFMVALVTLFGQAILRVGGFMTGGYDAVFQRQVF